MKLVHNYNFVDYLKQNSEYKSHISLCFHADAGQLNESAAATNTVEDAAAVSAISKQQILVQYLKVSF